MLIVSLLLIKWRSLKSWTNQSMSYRDHLQLVISVLVSMQVYWASIFMLHHSVTKVIESLMRSFMWLGNDMVKGRSKVVWKDVCLPTSGGGLGIRSLKS